MDLKTTIGNIDSKPKLEEVFAGGSLENLLQRGFGEELSRCLSDENENDKLNRVNLMKYSIILSSIIPPLPNFIEKNLLYTLRLSNNCSNYCTDMLQVEKLISMIIRPLFEVCNRGDANTLYVPFISKAVLKVIFYASNATLVDNEDVFPEKFFTIKEDDLDPRDLKKCDSAMALLGILGRMPKAWLHRFLKPKVLLRLRLILTRSNGKMCPLVDYLRKLYADLELEKQIEMNDPTMNLLFDACQAFQSGNATTALRCIADVIDENTVNVQHFIQSGVLYKLQSLLCSPTENGHTTSDIKAFLSIFLKFKSGAEDTYAWSGCLFQSLVCLVGESLGFFLSVLDTKLYSYNSEHDEASKSAIDNYERDIIVLLNLLQSLYILNSSWHQWFDIMEEKKIIGEEFFESSMFTLLLEMDFEDKTERLPWFIKMTEICPVVANLELRLEMFRKTLPIRKDRKSLKVKRENVLRDVAEIFKNNVHILSSCYWDFTFEGELAKGHGVTKEVYSILSQELQRQDFTLWSVEPPKRLSNEVLQIQSHKANKGTEEYIFLGQVMAKVILDGYLLDMPVANDFFQRLRPMKYPHLKKDYFDLPHTFPLLKSIFAQLLSVKRKVEIIRSESNLSERTKRELINNLPFDDSSSFDDLCLNFTVPGSDVELMEGGRYVLLSPNNIDLYLDKLRHHKLELAPESEHQFAAIMHGFDQTLLSGSIDMFSPEEIKHLIFCEQFKRLTTEDLHAHCVHDNSQSVQFLFESLDSLGVEEQKSFLKFATSATCLPFGGLSKLNPPLTISRIVLDHPDSSLPTATTCFNTIYLPDYSSLEVTKEKLLYAILEGGTFQIV